MKDNPPNTDYLIFLIPIFAEIICEDVPDKVRELHFSAYRKLAASLNSYKERGYCQKLLCGIAEKKGELILKTTSKIEMEKLLKPSPPHYDGAKFIPSQYNIAEEEL